MKTASIAYSNQMTRNNQRFDANDADPESRTGILRDTSSGKLDRDSEDDYACPGMLKLNDAFNKIGDVMTSLQERSSDSLMTNDERDEMVLELSRSLWSLRMAGYHFEKMVAENKSLNLASAPRSTEITLSHGHATSIGKGVKGTVVPNAESDLAEGQNELSIQDTFAIEDETMINEVNAKDSIHPDMLQSITTCSLPMGTLDVPFLDASSDLGSLVVLGANGLRDGDPGDPGDLQPDHVYKSSRDRRMMMNANEWEHVRNTCGTRWGSSPDAWFYGEPRMARRKALRSCAIR